MSYILLIIIIGYFGFNFYNSFFKTSNKNIDFDAKLVDGTDFKLSNLKGEYVLIDFWASWCGPCRIEIPKLIALQNKYPQKLKIVSIALEKDYQAGLNLSQKINFPWKYQIIEEHQTIFFSNIARSFGVQSIPSKFLIDPNGNIIKDLSYDAITEILNNL